MLEFPQIRDIAPPVEPSAALPAPWVWWTAAILLVLLLATGLILWLRAAVRRPPLPALPGSPEILALNALAELRRAPASLPAGDFALELTGIIRTFLHRQTGILARYATSPEILGDRSRPWQPPPAPGIGAFREVLTAADALKYGPAGAGPAPDLSGSGNSGSSAISGPAPAEPDPAAVRQRETLIDSACSAIRAAAHPPQPVPVRAEPPPLPAWVMAPAASRNPGEPAATGAPASSPVPDQPPAPARVP